VELKKLLYTLREAGELLSVSEPTVRRLAETGELELIYVAKREPRITADSIVHYINRKKQETNSLQTPA